MLTISKKHVVTISLALLVVVAMLVPLAAFAVDPVPSSSIIPCGLNQDANKVTTDACTFNDVVKLIKNVIDFLIIKIASPLAAVMFAYAGFLYMTNGGNEGQVKQAHDIFLNVMWGFVISLAAWLVVSSLLSFFVDDTFNFLK